MKTMVERRITICEAKKIVSPQQLKPSNAWDKPLEWPSIEKKEEKQNIRQESRERDEKNRER